MASEQLLRAAVIGAGHQGNYHAAKLKALPGVRLTHIVDSNAERAAAMAHQHGCAALHDHRALYGAVELAVVAAPTDLHRALAGDMLEHGVHVLLEKPMTKTTAEALELEQLARQRNLVLQVGHSERYNAAFRAASAHVREPHYVEAHRLARFRPRGTDIDVVLDLMIHDIDLALSLTSSAVKEVRAVGSRVLTDSIDIANARVEFANGYVASLTASRVSAAPMRKLRVFAPELYVSVDCLNHKVTTCRKSNTVTSADAPPLEIEESAYPGSDALGAQMASFVAAVRAGETCVVDASAGRRALEVALAVHEEMRRLSH